MSIESRDYIMLQIELLGRFLQDLRSARSNGNLVAAKEAYEEFTSYIEGAIRSDTASFELCEGSNNIDNLMTIYECVTLYANLTDEIDAKELKAKIEHKLKCDDILAFTHISQSNSSDS